MSIPAEIQAFVAQRDQELNRLELKTTEGLNLVRESLSLFPSNAIGLLFDF